MKPKAKEEKMWRVYAPFVVLCFLGLYRFESTDLSDKLFGLGLALFAAITLSVVVATVGLYNEIREIREKLDAMEGRTK